MKKTMTKLLAFLLAAVSSVAVFGLTACGEKTPDPDNGNQSEKPDTPDTPDTPNTPDTPDVPDVPDTPVVPEKSFKEQVLEYIESLNNVEVDGINTYATEYDDMVAYLKEQGVIDADAEPVDMNTNAGYMFNAMTGTLLDEPFAFADEAYDYGGVYLIRWDLDGEYTEYRTFSSSTTIQVGGGKYTLYCTAVSGAYALGFKSVNDVVNDWGYSYGNNSFEANSEKYNGDWSAWNADRTSAVNDAETVVAAEIETFTDIDATPNSIKYYTVSDLVVALRGAGFISALDVVNVTDLNSVYSLGEDGFTTTLNFATSAAKYGKISIYYYDTADSWFNFYAYSTIYKNLSETGTADVLYTTKTWAFEPYTYTGTEYDADGEQLTLTVDAVIGNFAIVIDED